MGTSISAPCDRWPNLPGFLEQGILVIGHHSSFPRYHMQMIDHPNPRFDFQVNHDLPTTSLILIGRIREHFTSSDAHWIEMGMAASERAHAGQYRGDGSPYAIHPYRVALLVLDHEPSSTKESLVSCLLHDVVEDTDLTQEDLSRQFGSVVGNLVAAVTRYRPQNETPAQKRDGKIANWHQIMAAPRDVRVVKTFDYCDNLVSCKFIAPDKPAFTKIPRWLMEAQTLYLPLAQETNRVAARLIETELRYYLAAGHKIGGWLD
jgi:guanosine-3',5'-bis(diphosphate) 3'-pyrophosphohydrolase